VAGYTGGTAATRKQRVRGEWGLGECLGSWGGSQLKGRVVLGWVLVGLGALGGVGMLTEMHESAPARYQDSGAIGGIVIVVAAGALLLAIPWRRRLWWLFLHEAGVAEVTGYRQRASVVRWADLASMTLGIGDGESHDYISGCTVRDHAGRDVTVDKRFGASAWEAVAAQAGQVLADRLLGTLTSQLDAGLPVTSGCLTVDWAGIRCRAGSRAAGGRWQVSWQQVRGVQTRMHGVEVSVDAGRRRRALVYGANNFLAGHLLEHAARQAGVPFTAG
jgi:hypothetical protein